MVSHNYYLKSSVKIFQDCLKFTHPRSLTLGHMPSITYSQSHTLDHIPKNHTPSITYPRSCTRDHLPSITYPRSLALHTLTQLPWITNPRSCTLDHTPSITHPRSHTHDHTPSITHPRSHTLDYTPSITHPRSRTLDYSPSITYPRSHTLDHTPSITPSITHPRSRTLDRVPSITYPLIHEWVWLPQLYPLVYGLPSYPVLYVALNFSSRRLPFSTSPVHFIRLFTNFTITRPSMNARPSNFTLASLKFQSYYSRHIDLSLFRVTAGGLRPIGCSHECQRQHSLYAVQRFCWTEVNQ